MTNNDIVNWGENWYEFKYFSYKEGALCLYKMPQDEFEEFKEDYEKIKDVCTRRGIKTLQEYICAVLSFNM